MKLTDWRFVGLHAISFGVAVMICVALKNHLEESSRLRDLDRKRAVALHGEICPAYRQWQARWAEKWRERLTKTAGRLSVKEFDLLTAGNKVQPFEETCP